MFITDQEAGRGTASGRLLHGPGTVLVQVTPRLLYLEFRSGPSG